MSRILLAEQISKLYDSFGSKLTVLDKLDFSLTKGEIVAITGESGSGKSTLLNILGGLDYVNKGKIYLFDQEIQNLNEKKYAQLRNKHIGFIFQNHNLLVEFTALENVMIPFRIYNNNIQLAKEKSITLLQKVGISNRLNHKVGELSGGEMQRVAIARTLITEPDIILADEPTGNLDQKNSNIIFDILLELSSEKQTAIALVTHSLQLAKKCESRFTLENGTLHKI